MSDDTDSVLPFSYTRMKSMADGSLQLVVTVEPADFTKATQLFNQPGVMGVMVRMTDDAAKGYLQQTMIQSAEQEEREYGEQAKALRLSGFFLSPDVWRAVGTDEQFLQWLRHQDCAFIKTMRYGSCGGQIVPAHVRRVENGSGTGIKPPYSAIPLCDTHHQIQHNHGESAIGGREAIDKLRLHYLQTWAWETLKARLGYDSWSKVPPKLLYAWAEKHELTQYLPAVYRPGSFQ